MDEPFDERTVDSPAELASLSVQLHSIMSFSCSWCDR